MEAEIEVKPEMASSADKPSSNMKQQLSTAPPMRISQPMIPKTLCINLITNNLSDKERLCVLDVLLGKLSSDHLVESCCLLFQKFASLKKMTDFICEDFSRLMMQALEKLHAANADNILYYLILWCLYGDCGDFVDETRIKDVIDGGKLFKEALTANELDCKQMDSKTNVIIPKLKQSEQVSIACSNVRPLMEDTLSYAEEGSSSVTRSTVRRSSRQNKGVKRKFHDETDKESELETKEIIEEDQESGEISPQAIENLIKIEVYDCNVEAKPKNDEVEKTESADGSLEEVANDDKLEDRDYGVDNEDLSDSDNETKVFVTKTRKNKANNKRDTSVKKGPRKYICELCDKVFVKKNLLMGHMNKHKEEKHWIVCLVCHRQFRDQKHLDEHSAKAHAPFLCEHCGKALKSKKALELHEHVHFPDKRPTYECPDCGKILRSVNGMRDHRITVHVRGRAKPYLCSECGQSFTFEKNLRKHTQRHEEKLKLLKCNECDKKFQTEEELEKHKEATHIEGEFRCRLCLRVYPTKARLRKHIQNIHTCPITDPEKLKALTCDKCGRVYRRKWELDYHKKRVHVEKEDFKCEFCNKLFASESLLDDHRAVHTREARFFCEVCGEGFVHRSTYKSHLFKHNAEKFECPLCNKQFDVPSYLTRHIREVHKDQPMPVLPQFKYTGPVASAKEHREMAKKAKETGQMISGREKAKFAMKDYSRKRKRRERMGPVKNVLLDKKKVTLDDVEELVIDEQELKALGDTELAVSNLPQGDGSISVQAKQASQFISIESKLPVPKLPVLRPQGRHVPEKLTASNAQQVLNLGDGQYVEEVHDEEVYEELVSAQDVQAVNKTKTIQLEIGGETQIIEVPDDAQFIQVGDSILQLDQIL